VTVAVVVDSHAATLAGELQGDALANSLAGSGNKGVFPFE
jgi:hypothetical protein